MVSPATTGTVVVLVQPVAVSLMTQVRPVATPFLRIVNFHSLPELPVAVVMLTARLESVPLVGTTPLTAASVPGAPVWNGPRKPLVLPELFVWVEPLMIAAPFVP